MALLGCCDDQSATCTTAVQICGDCALARVGESCANDAGCCNNVGIGGPIACEHSGASMTCQLQ